jgi:AhpD family alkylhydroperoxidase
VERIDYRKFGRAGFQLLGQLSDLSKKGSLGHVLIEFVKLRASQINHCAHCVNRHANLLRKEGESEERLQSVVGRGDLLFRAREGGIRMDGSGDAGSGHRRTRRRL